MLSDVELLCMLSYYLEQSISSCYVIGTTMPVYMFHKSLKMDLFDNTSSATDDL